tara:strand:+ start:427 stop:2097 length:1671 start_codon:yes stop_codon:yes gene_type:complete
MLTRLYINNFITIEEIDVNFSKGFTSITGETGSGKSVILDALNLLCGNRLDSSKIINREKKIVIEAEFDISNFNMLDFFDNNEIDYFDTTIIRREINPAGKSRSFINDSPVKLDLLKLFSLNIIDIHSQHESLLLNNEFFQLNFIDDFIKNKDNNYSSMISNYRDQYMVNQRLSDELEELRIKNKIIKDEYENIVFSLNELSEITLNKGEKKQLVNEYNFLKNSSEIKIQLEKTIKLLNIDDNSVIHQLNQILLSLKKIKNYSEKIEEFSKRVDNNIIDLQDISREIDIFYDSLDVDITKLSLIEDQLNKINSLEEKYLVKSFDALIDKRDYLLERKKEFLGIENNITELESKFIEHTKKIKNQAELISKKRREAAFKIEKLLINDLHSLGIKNAKILFEFNQLEKTNYHGIDSVDLLFSANKGMDLKPVKKIASGGELSRLMLIIKKHIFISNNLSTIIFDEIDSGVSGEIAEKVGLMIKEISKKQQVITITHLPQVASMSNFHYKVLKLENSNSSVTQLHNLNKEERILEIARLLSGKNISNEAVANAEKMIAN